MFGTILTMTWNPCTWDVPTTLTCIGAMASTFAVLFVYCVATTSSEEAKMLIKTNSENTQKQIDTLNSNNAEQIKKLVKLANAMSSQTDEVIKLGKIMGDQIEIQCTLLNDYNAMTSYTISEDLIYDKKRLRECADKLQNLMNEQNNLAQSLNNSIDTENQDKQNLTITTITNRLIELSKEIKDIQIEQKRIEDSIKTREQVLASLLRNKKRLIDLSKD